MNFSNFSTGKNDISRRVDKVIRLFVTEISLPEIYKGIRKGLIKINNKKTKADYRIKENDVISIADVLLKRSPSYINNTSSEEDISYKNYKKNMPDIVFENEHILILNKPYNINVHGEKNSLDKIVQLYYKDKGINNSLSFKPGPLHRLDRNTTGLIAFSMSLEGAQWFSSNIKNHNIRKKYYGLVEGKILSEEKWTDYILSNFEKGKYFHTVEAREANNNGVAADSIKNVNMEKQAETIATPIAWGKLENKDVTLVSFSIKTGRKHQIRAQSSLHKHPLVGDSAYGGTKINFGRQFFYLTAKELIFPEPNPIGLPGKLSITLPLEFSNMLKHCGIDNSGI